MVAAVAGCTCPLLRMVRTAGWVGSAAAAVGRRGSSEGLMQHNMLSVPLPRLTSSIRDCCKNCFLQGSCDVVVQRTRTLRQKHPAASYAHRLQGVTHNCWS